MRIHRPFSFAAALMAAPVALLAAAAAAPAEEFYYVAMFGSQTTPNNPNYAHTFAVFVRASGEGPCPKAFVVKDSFCISWLPANLVVRTRALLPECGRNLGLHETLHYVLDEGERVSMWGPYQVEQELYDRAVTQFGVLNSGQVKYKALDSGYNSAHVSNCIHAVSTVDGGYRLRVLSPGFGEMAAWFTLQRYGPWIIDRDTTHEWVYAYLGLQDYPINRRDYDRNPQSGAVWSVLKRAVGQQP